jgi:amino acid permease
MDLLLDVVFVGVSVAFFTVTGMLVTSHGRGVRPPTAPRLSWAAFAAVMVPFLIMFGLLLRMLRG